LLCGDELEQAWLDDRPVSCERYERISERYVREHAAQYPGGVLARELRALDTRRRRLRWARAIVVPSVRRRRSVAGIIMRAARSRAHQRGPRTTRARLITARSGGDPPEPPACARPGHRRAGASELPNAVRRLAARTRFAAERGGQ